MIKFFAATALPISFLAMHQEKTAASTDICSFPALHSEAEVRLAVLSPEEDRQVRLVMVHPEKEKGFDLVASIDDICNIAVKVESLAAQLRERFRVVEDLVRAVRVTASQLELTLPLHPSEFDRDRGLLLCR